jgi:outer membrane protein assembly factor BamB
LRDCPRAILQLKLIATMKSLLFLIITTSAAVHSTLAEEQWPQFRGPEGNGHTRSTGLPLKWDGKTNITWRTPIHDRGWSSPVIWGDQIWITTATKGGQKLFAVCVDKNTGKIIHDLHVFDVELPMAITADNTYATPTPVIEEGRVYIHFGTYGTACLDTKSGDTLWERRDLRCDHEKGAGPASSPLLIGSSLVLHLDGRDVQYVIALNKTNGKTLWKTTRSIDFADIPVHERKAYCTPTLIPRGQGEQLISVAAKGVFAYDPVSGKEIWKVRHRGWSIAPRPIYGHGLVFAIVDRDRPELWAIRPDGHGDVTDSHVAWRETRRMPPRASPLLVGDLLFLVNRNGVATCLEAESGNLVWQERIKGAYSVSPIHAKDRIYFFSEDGVCTIIKPARTLEILAVNSLPGERLLATPAIAGNALFIRSENHLYRIEEAPSRPTPK